MYPFVIVAHRHHHHHCLSSTRILEHPSNRSNVLNDRVEIKSRKKIIYTSREIRRQRAEKSVMNLMFRKNFGGDKGLGGGGLTSGGGLGEVRPALGTTTYGTSGASFGQIGTRFNTTRGGIGQSVVTGVRGPVRRSREFGYFPNSMGDHEHQGSHQHGYRTHLFLSPPAGGTLGSPPEDTSERLGPPPRRNSGPHVIKWGGGGSISPPQGGQTGNQVRRKQNQIGQQKEPSDPPTPTASRQVSTIKIFNKGIRKTTRMFSSA